MADFFNRIPRRTGRAEAVDVDEDGDLVVPFSEAFLVDADVRNGIRLTSLEARYDGLIHDRLGRVPGESEGGSGGFDLAARLQDFRAKRLEAQRETVVLSGPWRHDRLHTVIRAAAFRQSGDQLRGELHRVEGEPAAFFRVNGKAAGLATVRTQNARANVSQVDSHSSLRKPKVNSIASPGVVGAQKSGIVHRECVHPPS